MIRSLHSIFSWVQVRVYNRLWGLNHILRSDCLIESELLIGWGTDNNFGIILDNFH